jgi:hypothetical protein
MTTSFINRIILIAVLTFSFAANGMAKEPSLMDYNGIEYFTWNIDDNGTLHVTPLADVTPDFQESPFIKYRKQIKSIVFEEDFYNETTLSKIGKNFFKGLDKVESVILPHSVKSVDETVFEGCTSLKKLSTTTSNGINADSEFQGCADIEENYNEQFYTML